MINSRVGAENLDVRSIITRRSSRLHIHRGSTATFTGRARRHAHEGPHREPVTIADIRHFNGDRRRAEGGRRGRRGDHGRAVQGEKGKIKRVDKTKNEVTIELLEASIPIPVTIAMEFIKVIRGLRRLSDMEKTVEVWSRAARRRQAPPLGRLSARSA